MRRAGFIFALLLGIGGCRSRELAPPPQPTPPQLALTGRMPIEPDVTAVSMKPAASAPARPTQYHKLTVAECRFLALKNAPLAADLDAHPDNLPPRFSHSAKHAETARLSQLLRGYAADEIRNRAASEALELYYKLLAAEGQFDLLVSAQGILRTQLTAAEKAIMGGADDRADVDKLRRQLLSLESQLAKLEAGIATLNAGLAGWLGLDPTDPTPIWPADALRVADETCEVDPLVQTALRYRPDLNLLRVLTEYDDPGGALAKAMLNSVNPLMGTKDSANPLMPLIAAIKHSPTKWEARTQQQVESLLRSRERQAEAEVRAAAATLRGDRASVAAKVAEVKNLTAKVADLEKRANAGVAGAEAEHTLARLDLLKLRAELVQAAADWHLADVKLRQATGMLVRE